MVSKKWIKVEQVIEQKALSEKHQLAIALESNYRDILAEAKLTMLQRSIVRCLEESAGLVLVSRGEVFSASFLTEISGKEGDCAFREKDSSA
jgi:hypothetical protein